jgi:hypothetical protein
MRKGSGSASSRQEPSRGSATNARRRRQQTRKLHRDTTSASAHMHTSAHASTLYTRTHRCTQSSLRDDWRSLTIHRHERAPSHNPPGSCHSTNAPLTTLEGFFPTSAIFGLPPNWWQYNDMSVEVFLRGGGCGVRVHVLVDWRNWRTGLAELADSRVACARVTTNGRACRRVCVHACQCPY